MKLSPALRAFLRGMGSVLDVGGTLAMSERERDDATGRYVPTSVKKPAKGEPPAKKAPFPGAKPPYKAPAKKGK